LTKFFRLIFCIVGVYLKLSESTSIECEYYTGEWKTLGNLYCCSVKKDPKITTRESATITSLSGEHKSGKTNSDVESFRVHAMTINYFPRGLEKFFKNIKAITVGFSNLKQIHQEDLKSFPKLAELYFFSNSIKVLEQGLFDFNPDLQRISFEHNKIINMEPEVFDHLNKLGSLLLYGNSCIDDGVIAYNSTEVKNLIHKAEAQCKNSNSFLFEDELENTPEPPENPKTENIDRGEKITSTTSKIETSTYPKYLQNSSNWRQFDRILNLFYLLFIIFYI